MKTLTLTLGLLFSLSSFAIKNSQLDSRHQQVIKKSVMEHCHLRRSQFEEMNTNAIARRVDQGILDYDYTTVLKVSEWIDQGLTDSYKVTVQSDYSDSYDHETRQWGIYSVSSVRCELL